MSLDVFFKDICKELENGENVSKKFANVKTDLERFVIAYDVCQEYFSRLKLKSICKCNENSITSRKEGNLFFKNYSYWKALLCYNKSIAFALNGSEELGFGYGNRASCLLRLNFPEEALQDIKQALKLCTSNIFKEKLLARREHCISILKEFKKMSVNADFGSGDIPQLSRGKSSFFDSVSSVVELTYDKYWERQLIANDSVRVGEVLIIEKPFSSLILPKYFYTHCTNCFKRSLNLIPCCKCTTAMFCSKECLNNANHGIECAYLGILSKLNAESMELLSLKVLVDASKQGNDLENLYLTVMEYQSENISVNNYSSSSYNSSDFLNIFNLVTNTDKRTSSDLFYRSIISAILILILENYTVFFNNTADDRKQTLKMFCGGLVLHFMQSLPCNAHEISEYHSASLLEIGAGVYATLSLINHSCDPNVVRYSCKNEIVLRAIKPIKKGEQLFDNYGYHHATHDLQERQNALMKQYYFKCCCEACICNWPKYNLLQEKPLPTNKVFDVVFYNKLTKEFEEDLIRVLNGDYSISIIEKNMAYLNFLHEIVERPWINYNKCQELIKHCLNFHSNYFNPSNSTQDL